MDNDKTTKLRKVVLSFLNDEAESYNKSLEGTTSKVIIDDENSAYLLLTYGWAGKRYHHGISYHFDIKDGKIWIQTNATENEIVDVFMEKGVKPEEIVLGLVPPRARIATGFAVA